MLKISKSITLNGQCAIDNTQVMYMSASLSTDGKSQGNINVSIVDDAIYNANKEECRKAIQDFQTQVYNAQDSIVTVQE